jgi:hypothetical protein
MNHGTISGILMSQIMTLIFRLCQAFFYVALSDALITLLGAKNQRVVQISKRDGHAQNRQKEQTQAALRQSGSGATGGKDQNRHIAGIGQTVGQQQQQ